MFNYYLSWNRKSNGNREKPQINLILTLWCLYIGLFVPAEDGKDTTNGEAPENNAQYTTVYVGNLAPEVK